MAGARCAVCTHMDRAVAQSLVATTRPSGMRVATCGTTLESPGSRSAGGVSVRVFQPNLKKLCTVDSRWNVSGRKCVDSISIANFGKQPT